MSRPVRRVTRLAAWLGRRLALEESQRLLVLTLVVGVACGLAAVAFHQAITFASRFAIDAALAAPGRTWIPWTLAVAVGGGLASGALLHKAAPNARGSGIPQVKAAFALAGGRLRLRDSVAKFLLSTLQIGTGSSLGREGPTVQICAGVASAVGRVGGVSALNLRRLLPVGAAAGVAAAFNAPIAAVTFTVEEIVGSLDNAVLSGAIVAAAVAAVVERSILGVHPMFSIPEGYGLTDASSLLFYALLGLLAAFVSLGFRELLLGLRARFRASRIPPWCRPAVGALVTAALATVAVIVVGAGGVTGGGYATLGTALGGALPLRVLLVLCVLKVVATAFSYSSGGAGGIFAPVLFIGGMLGGAVGMLDARLLDHGPGSLGAFALVGMGAVFAGTIRAPMTSVLIIIEMTDGYALILPLMIANMLAYGVARRFRPTPIYEALLEQDGVRLRARAFFAGLDELTLGEADLDRRPFASFSPRATARELVGATASRQQSVFPVLDEEQRLVGVVTLEDLTVLAGESGLEGVVCAADLMRAPLEARVGDPLRGAFELMQAHGVRELPVLDAERRVVGFVDEATIAHAYIARRAPA